MGLVFVPNPAFEEELRVEVEDEVILAAAKAKRVAERIAPVDEADYKNSFSIDLLYGDVALNNTDFKAHWIEWGTVDTPTFGVMRRAVLLTGLKFRATPKKK